MACINYRLSFLRFYIDFSKKPPIFRRLPGRICGKIETWLWSGAWKGDTKHCFQGLYKSYTRYLENMLYRNVFFKVSKARKIKNGMTGKVWLSLTAKAKEKLIHTFGRKHFTIDKIAEDIYISSPHFVEGKVPTNVDLVRLWAWTMRIYGNGLINSVCNLFVLPVL